MKKAVVFGLGISGTASANLLMRKGFSVIGIDARVEVVKKNPAVQELETRGLSVVSESSEIPWTEIAFVVLSPGISQEHPVCVAALKAGVSLLGEAELAFYHLVQQRCLGITGTNGKTTVTLLAAHVLSACGIPARALGNVGDPLTTYALDADPKEVVVAELSSYQLETMHTRALDGAVILNITPDHLDRHHSMRAYAAAKCRILSCLKEGASLLVHEEVMRTFSDLLPHAVQRYGQTQGLDFWTDKRAIYHFEKIETLLPVRYRELGVHESENALAVWALVRGFGVAAERFCQALETFQKPPHRIEFVKDIDGVAYYDDSKGTNIDAVIQAVGAMRGPVVLIAGGVHKGASYLPWCESFAGKVRKVITIGEAAGQIESDLKPFFAVERVESLADAVALAAQVAVEGDSVLLSPGCSSFDMFCDYAHRGREFQRYVHRLEGRRK